MASEFPQVSIGDLVDRGHARLQTGPFGSQLHKHDYTDEGIPVIPTEAIGRGRIVADAALPLISETKAGELSRHRLMLGDILFARRGIQATGLSAIVDQGHVGSICGTGALLLRVDPDAVDPKFMAAYLSTAEAFDWLRSNAVGAVMPNLNTSIISRLRVPMPPMGVQAAVGQFIACLDDRIDLLRQTNATLEAIAQALFKSWFVDFDPVRAKAEGREPEGMDAATAALFPSEFEDSELGLIPKGWHLTRFDREFDFTMGQSPPGTTYNTACIGVPFFQGCTDFGLVFPAERIYCSQPTRFARAGDLLMSVRAPVGALNIARADCSIGRGLCAIRHKSGSTGLTQEFVRACVKRIEAAAGEGALFKSLSKNQLAGLPVLCADDAVVEAMVSILNPLTSRRVAAARQAEQLVSIRDTLLPRLISGKLRLPEAEEAGKDAP